MQRADLDAHQRSQILGGVAACTGRKGYGATTIADIAAAAHLQEHGVLLGALGGINEHMLRAVEDGSPRLRGVTAEATDLLERILQRKDI